MDQIISFIKEYATIDNILYVLALLDIARGSLPNSWKFCKDAGIILTIFKKMAEYDKKKPMNHLIILATLTVFTLPLFQSCAFVKLNPTQKVITKISARRIGLAFAEKYPEYRDEAVKVCDRIVNSSDDPNDLIREAINNLLKAIEDDPLLQADVRDVLALIDFTIPKDDSYIEHIAELRAIVRAFRHGVESSKKIAT